MQAHRFITFALLGLTVTGFAGCAEGESIAGNEPSVDGTSGAGSGAGGGGGSGGAPSGGAGQGGAQAGAGGAAAGGANPGAGGATGAGGDVGPPTDGGPPDSGGDGGAADAGPCQDTSQKFCDALCVAPTPAVGCSEPGCTPCPSTLDGFPTCSPAGDCDIGCNIGFVASGGACVPEGGSGGATGAGGSVSCTPLTCANYPGQCGSRSNGCSGTLDCNGNCSSSEVCAAGACCTPTDCSAFPGQCGSLSNGCGGTLDCSGNCSSGQICNAGACCSPVTCTAYPNQCGSLSNGCGGTLDCNGNCSGGQVCSSGSCCTPITACPGSAKCGTLPDGCGGTVGPCGTCPTSQGCSSQNTCVDVVGFPYTPTNFDPAGLDPGATAQTTTLSCGVSTFDSTTLTFTNWCGQATPVPVVRPQTGGADLVILPLRSLTLAGGATLRVVGDRPVILAVHGDAAISGTIDTNGSGITPGAGGNASCGSSAGGNGIGSCGGGGGGGGGGGHARNGASGGSSGTPGTGGAARGSATPTPLIGGCPGGNGGGCATTVGGGGGGAVQLSASGTLTLSATASVAATGAAGLNGACDCSESGGGGGGSGGTIVLEGDAVSTTAGSSITANGGRGGTGAGGPAGGNGGTGTTAPAVGGNSGNGAGGGGGSAGRGYVRGVTSCSLSGTTSLALATGGVCPAPPPAPPSGSNCRYLRHAGHQYFFCDETNRNWNEGRTQCQSIGFDLVRVDDAAENEFIRTSLTVAQPYALGARDATEGQWRWVIGDAHFWQGTAGGSAQNGLYSTWNTGEPNASNSSEDWAYIDGTGRWNDDDNPDRPFVCESL